MNHQILPFYKVGFSSKDYSFFGGDTWTSTTTSDKIWNTMLRIEDCGIEIHETWSRGGAQRPALY